MSPKRRRLIALCCSLPALPLALAAAPVGAAKAFPPQAIPADARCPVCGMYPARYPKWMAQIVFRDGRMSAFESPAELFRFLRDMSRYDNSRQLDDVGSMYVTDYARGGWVPAKAATYVSGSRAKGPMGPDLPAFATRTGAQAFAREQGGRLLGFDVVTPAVIDGLRHAHGMNPGSGAH